MSCEFEDSTPTPTPTLAILATSTPYLSDLREEKGRRRGREGEGGGGKKKGSGTRGGEEKRRSGKEQRMKRNKRRKSEVKRGVRRKIPVMALATKTEVVAMMQRIIPPAYDYHRTKSRRVMHEKCVRQKTFVIKVPKIWLLYLVSRLIFTKNLGSG